MVFVIVHALIRQFHQLQVGPAILRIMRYTDRAADLHQDLIKYKILLQLLLDFLRHGLHFSLGVHLMQQNNKFIAANPRHRIRATHRLQ